ncbi:MAG: DUF4258 domain-containing protein [Thermodesulfobacteriota bacterium]|nr:DUF4258 domain-containing protein [Thermodesulfobacteriota bacterium]
MHDSTLKKMQEAIRNRQYVMTLHAEEEMDDDDLSIFDIEHIVLFGKIIEKQKDQVTKEWKYFIEGQSFSNELTVVVAKISMTGKLVIITVFKL